MINLLLIKSYDFCHILTYLDTKAKAYGLRCSFQKRKENNNAQSHVSMANTIFGYKMPTNSLFFWVYI